MTILLTSQTVATRESKEARALDGPDREGADWFVGDLDDPWVVAIADALPAVVARQPCAGDLPVTLFDALPPPRTVVLHRAVLTPHDAEVVARFRGNQKPPPRLVLCHGPHVRHADLERWSALVDCVIPEATARETIARRLSEGGEEPRPAGPRPRVCVVSDNFGLRAALADACAAGGYPVEPAFDWSEASPSGLAVWDVPVLEPDWPRQMARRSRSGPLVALLGFPDRALVTQARAQGAAACLELPCDPADLISVLDRLALARAEPAHEVPPPPFALPRAHAKAASRLRGDEGRSPN